jgi:hypothetical protein
MLRFVYRTPVLLIGIVHSVWNMICTTYHKMAYRRQRSSFSYPSMTDEEILGQVHQLQNVPWCEEYEKMVLGKP